MNSESIAEYIEQLERKVGQLEHENRMLADENECLQRYRDWFEQDANTLREFKADIGISPSVRLSLSDLTAIKAAVQPVLSPLMWW